MTDLHALFERAVTAARRLPERPDNDTLLRLYALYKQATEGDARGPQPGFFDFVGCAKREAWEQLAGMSDEEAMRNYVTLARSLGAKV
ncbi:acyl-CoA-binding protein [Oleiagrimonas soli]|uniref:Acyl-CoA-binding protein n=1 Tax=Oleiagrimonas soli TaxID=1543381 RepID=A0A099CXH2_9GAMM|nr:acyl-CoA-binding protein [Oleiagrimonas soli]KGI78434.1 acyl-CoA-binding protein [Oleiagrimonas soli]MBB6183332.1 acyl-CoA-binding protein [Oleiagrimonas soli]